MPDVAALLDEQMLVKVKSGAFNKTEIIENILHTTPMGAVSNGIDILWEDPVIPRYNGERAKTVMCSPVSGVPTEIARRAIAEKVDKIELPDGYEMMWRGEKQASSQTMYYLFKNVPLGIVLIIAILILLFKITESLQLYFAVFLCWQ